jgi:hypothetical protein
LTTPSPLALLPPTQAVVAARRKLLVKLQDVACIVATTYVTQPPADAKPKAAGDAPEAAGAAPEAAGAESGEAAGGAGAGGGGGAAKAGRRVMANRLVVLECAPRDPSLLRVRPRGGARARAPRPAREGAAPRLGARVTLSAAPCSCV